MVRDRRATLVWALLLGCGFGTNSPGDNAGLGEGSTSAAADGGSDRTEGNQGGTADGDVTGSMNDDDDDDDVTGSTDDDDDDDDDATTEGPSDTGDSGGSSSTGVMGDDDDDDMDVPYGACPGGGDGECTGEQICLAGGGYPSACAQPCTGPEDCAPPADGDATPFCAPIVDVCLLGCGSGETCPTGMSCFASFACGHD